MVVCQNETQNVGVGKSSGVCNSCWDRWIEYDRIRDKILTKRKSYGTYITSW